MKTLLVAAAVATVALSAPAYARGDITCSIRDTVGNNLTYAFGDNTFNAKGSFGGTEVETGFDKNGTSVFTEVGRRPIWVYGANTGGGFNLYSRAAPGWAISVVGNGAAMLTHNGRFAGNGWWQTAGGATQASVGDQGE
jgi:hypothetical protein